MRERFRDEGGREEGREEVREGDSRENGGGIRWMNGEEKKKHMLRSLL